eukprot:4993716-Amphidinium_carterae.1
METRVSELMAAGRDVTDSRDRLWEEIRSARNNQQAEQSELQARHARALGISSEEVSSLRERLSCVNAELARAQEVDSARRRQLASEEAVIARLTQDLRNERTRLEN